MYKLQDLIPGEWYHSNHLNYTFKFSHSTEDDNLIRVYHTRRIYAGSSQDHMDYFSNNEMLENISKASPDVISAYFSDEVPAINNSYSII